MAHWKALEVYLLAATGTATSLPLGCFGDPLRLQGRHIGVGVIALLLVASAVDDAHNVINCHSLHQHKGNIDPRYVAALAGPSYSSQDC